VALDAVNEEKEEPRINEINLYLPLLLSPGNDRMSRTEITAIMTMVILASFAMMRTVTKSFITWTRSTNNMDAVNEEKEEKEEKESESDSPCCCYS
jgi:hypothetical protein